MNDLQQAEKDQKWADLKRWVLRAVLKAEVDWEWQTSWVNEFHQVGPAKEKDLWPNDFSLHKWNAESMCVLRMNRDVWNGCTWSEAERDIIYRRSVDESVEAYEPNVASSFTPQTYHAKYHLWLFDQPKLLGWLIGSPGTSVAECTAIGWCQISTILKVCMVVGHICCTQHSLKMEWWLHIFIKCSRWWGQSVNFSWRFAPN